MLPDIISPDQTGFVDNRYIGCNIQRLENPKKVCLEENINGVLININFEKAFNSIVKALRLFNFPEKFIDWVHTFYTDIETCIQNNGHTTTFFKPERGVGQGCPLSSLPLCDRHRTTKPAK